MKLRGFLAQEQLPPGDFAARLGVSAVSISRYCNENRIPAPAIMRRIFVESGGAVAPNDFYDLPDLPDLPELAELGGVAARDGEIVLADGMAAEAAA